MSKYSEFFLLGSADYENISDKLRLRKYGSWLAEEAWLREDQNRKRAQFTLRTIQMARQIAATKGISEEEAFQLLQNESNQSFSLFAEFAEEAGKLMDSAPSGREQFEDLVTMFFRNRGEVYMGKKWCPTNEWSNEDTNKLPKILLQKIEAFMGAEDEMVQGSEEGDEEGPK
jgi:hypothetical protein